jgi:hypothetical protein
VVGVAVPAPAAGGLLPAAGIVGGAIVSALIVGTAGGILSAGLAVAATIGTELPLSAVLPPLIVFNCDKAALTVVLILGGAPKLTLVSTAGGVVGVNVLSTPSFVLQEEVNNEIVKIKKETMPNINKNFLIIYLYNY